MSISLFSKQFFTVLTLMLAVLTLTGCNNDIKGSASESAKSFFHAIYNEKNINNVVMLSSADLKVELSKYKTANHLARQFLNLSYDYVDIETGFAQKKIRKEYDGADTINVLLTGKRHGKIFKEFKRVKVIKQGNAWLVDKILPDEFPE